MLGRSLLLPLLLSGTFLTGCLDISEDGIDIRPRVPYQSSVRDVGEPLIWQGEPIDVHVERGNVEVVGDPGATSVRVTSRAMTWASYGDTGDAKAMNDAILSTAFARVEDGFLKVGCKAIDDDIGSAQAASTQCNLRVMVPAPDGATHDVHVTTGLGDAFLANLSTSPWGAIDLYVVGSVEAWGLRGNVHSQASENDIEATPLPGGFIDADSTIILQVPGDREQADQGASSGTTLRLPSAFGANAVDLASQQGSVLTADFPNLASGVPHNPGPSAAALVRGHADWGDVKVLTLHSLAGRSRTSDLGQLIF